MVAAVALAEAFQVANVHISSLLAVFTSPELNPVWNDRLIEQKLLYIDGKRHAYQVYQLPWPVADRELLILCKDTELASQGVYESWCESVVNEQLPIGEGRVRAHIHGAKWRFEAMADGQTLIRFKGSIDPMGPLPKWFVSSAQKFVSKSTISGLVSAQGWLGVPPLEQFAHWGGAGAAGSAQKSRVGAGGVRGWCGRSAWCPFVQPGSAVAAALPPALLPLPTSPPPTLLMALLLCAGVALSAWAARRLSWQGLLRCFVRARARRTPVFTMASEAHGTSLRKARSCVQMPCRAPALQREAAGVSHFPDLSDVLTHGAAPTQMRRSASAHSRAFCRQAVCPEPCL